MKSFLAIVKQTMRSAIRAKVFHVLGVLILLSVFLLPATVSGDGTAKGLVQISLTYSLGIVVALISTTALWLSCSQLSREIEAYNIHLVFSKPCSRPKMWFAKWTGIFLMHAVILIISAAIIYALIQFRIYHETKTGRFTQEEIAQLNKEIRVGRRVFKADKTDLRDKIEEEYKRRKDAEFRDAKPEVAKSVIYQQLITKGGEVPPGGNKIWNFNNVTGKGNILYLRYRMYSGSTEALSQRNMPGLWCVRDPKAPAGVEAGYQAVALMEVMGGTFQELELPKECINTENGNSVSIMFMNPPKDTEYWRGVEAASAMFQEKDGPELLIAVSSFFSNYCRAIFLALLQIAFLVALGCTVSAAFSTPVAAFVAVAYLVIGMSVSAAVDAPNRNADGSYQYKNVFDRSAHYFAIVVSNTVVSVNDLDATSDLARGHLVENRRIIRSLISLLLLKTGIMSAVGIWILSKRELGLVIRK